ncbi:MAG TPA: MmcQ/YjbR family DNA-binding protein [Nannocystaceae bacterium]|nr:MmcQ/YjbR family DNA-binding protein [Nannocystaceae bacterium]
MTKSAKRTAAKKPSTVDARKAAGGGGAELAKLRKIVLAIPGAIEKLSHGEPTWFTGEKGKVFAMFDNHHHGAAHISVYFAATIDAQELLIAEDPARYWRPPYVGHKGWIAVILDTKPDWKAVEHLAREAFAMIAAPKRPRR